MRALIENHLVVRVLHANGENGEFHEGVFWGVNAFLLVILLSVCMYCYCNHQPIFSATFGLPGSTESDLVYQRTVLERQRIQAEKAKDTPEQREKKLTASFERNQVRMVRAETNTPSDCRTLHVRSFCSHAALRICFALVLSLFCLFLGGQGRGLDG